MLVVISIIAVLAALLMPTLKGALVAARTARSISNLKQISAAMLLFTTDHDGYMVTNGGIYVTVDGNPTPQTGWRNLSLLYLSPNLDLTARERIFYSPNAAIKCTGGNRSNYSVHPWLDNNHTPYKSSMVQKPATCIMVADGTDMGTSTHDSATCLWPSWVGNSPVNNPLPTGKLATDKLDQDDGTQPPTGSSSRFAYRNGDMALAVFFDGHVEKFKMGQMTYGNFQWK
ncbi:MAG: type II secretion system protein [Verrucomicrobiota bacterium]